MTAAGGSRRGRAAERQAFVAGRAGEFDRAALAAAMADRLAEERRVAEEAAGRADPAAAAGIAEVFATGDARRWVPIGPSVIRSITRASFKRSTGRVRDLQVSDDGSRAYAATAKGGLWYTDDAGGFWSPVGGWAERSRVSGGAGNAQACGCLLVTFDPGGDVAKDYVMVGTGELQGFGRPPVRPALGGIGVLAARGPATVLGAGGDPWEPEAGLALFEGKGVFRLARDPKATAGKPSGADADRVVAGTSAGLFLGTRGPAGPPHNGKFTWVAKPALRAFMGGFPAGVQPLVTDVLWLDNGTANGRIVVALARGLETVPAPAPVGSGVAYSDDLGATFHWVTGLNPSVAGAQKGIGRMSLANPAADRVYVLGERRQLVPVVSDIPSLWRVETMNAAAPAADRVAGVPPLWTRASTGKNQRDYDQAIAVDVVGGTDRVYLAGNVIVLGPTQHAASVWCFNVKMPAKTLEAVPDISRAGTPPAGDGASVAGLVGDDIHVDVHTVRLAGAAGPDRQVWVTCDGGVYVSHRAGRVNTFLARATGLSAVEVNFHAAHPTSSHFGAIGTQDNGRHVRVGDVVWEDVMGGDGGGVAIHPNASQFIVSQFHGAGWNATPAAGFVDPLDQGSGVGATDREDNLSAFYSGAATARKSALVGRLAIGTNRVWVSDDLGGGPDNTWNALPFASAASLATNPRAGGLDALADRKTGVPGGGALAAVAAGGVGPLGEVITLKWASPLVLLAVFAKGLVRWKQDGVTLKWTSQLLVGPGAVGATGAPNVARTLLSDVAPLPGSDFYLVTTGDTGTGETCLYFTDSDTTFRKTGLRAELPPLDPAYAAAADPADSTVVYVGTVTGVWRGERLAGPPTATEWPHAWTPDVNGLPQAAVQDLDVWTTDPPVAGDPRLLRASFQSRGVWELDLAAATEPQRTYLRVHAADDRRRLPTPMADPRLEPGAPAALPYASPDIVVRPQAGPAAPPKWGLAAGTFIDALNPVEYELWTFQTALRWLYPSVAADGRWSDALGRLVELHRSTAAALAPVEQRINEALWKAVVGDIVGGVVVGGTRVDAAGRVNNAPGDPLAVYHPPWQTPVAMNAVPTEIDLIDNVVMSQLAGVAQVYREESTVDVLVHHRDTRPLAAGDAFVILLWSFNAAQAPLLAQDVSPLLPYVAGAVAGGPVPATPAGWNPVLTGAGSPLHRLPVPLDARMPRAVSIDVDLSAVTAGHRVLLVAVAGSSVDRCGTAPVGLPATPTIADLVGRWPYAAARLVRVIARP